MAREARNLNKRFHRVVVNAARGSKVVVQETARAMGKVGATPLVAAAMGAFGAFGAFGALAALPASAQIVGAPGAPANLRPMVLTAPNGVPLVNIRTPSASGVSRNLYNQFDVSARGLILNNARTAAQTQLGGLVQGNPFLANGPARVILNEIVGGNPTQLQGAIEVAGQRAEVIVANPAGIAVAGGTFINAHRATLTTGVPQINAAGGLDGFVVRNGTVTFDGSGLDARSTDYAAILARAAQVNAAIWANELQIVTGANEVSADGTQFTPTTGTGAPPRFALDVAHVGGMYAGHIRLIGTEHGLGARNAGSMYMGPGEFVMTLDGRLINKGSIEAQQMRIAASDIDNRGGTIRQTGGAGLVVDANSLGNSAGGVIGVGPQATESPGTIAGSAGPTGVTAPGAGGSTGAGGVGMGSGTSSASTSLGPGRITATGSLLNDGGRIYAGGPIALRASQVDNTRGSITASSLSTAGPSFSNAGGTISVTGGFSAKVDRFDNTAGSVRASSVNIASSGELINQGGKLESDGLMSLSAGGLLDNTKGNIESGSDLSIQAQRLTNTGKLHADGNSSLGIGGALVNSGSITSSRSVVITAGSLNNDAGRIIAVGELSATVAGALRNQAGAVAANGNTTLNAANLHNDAGAIAAVNGKLSVTTTGTTSNVGGSLQAGGAVDVAASGLNNTQGKITGTSVRIDARGADFDNRAGQALATGDLRIDAGAIYNTGALIRSQGTTTLNAGSIVNANTQGKDQGIEGQNVRIGARELNNTDGAIRADRNASVTSPGAVYNTRGLISAGDTLSITDPHAAVPSAKTLDVSNLGGSLTAGRSLTVDAASLHSSGKLLSGVDATWALSGVVLLESGSETVANRQLDITAGGAITNRGRIAAGESVLLAARTIDNTATGDIQASVTGLLASEAITNRGVIDGNSTRLDAPSVTNIGTGRIYGDHVSIGAATLHNVAETVDGIDHSAVRSATIAARSRLDIGASAIQNRDGALIFSDGDLAIGGALDAQRHAAGQAGVLNNHAASIEATRSVDIRASVLHNTNGGVTWALVPGASNTTQRIVEYLVPGSNTRYPANEVFFGSPSLAMLNPTGWNNWSAIAATDPLAPGASGTMKLLVPSPDYPVSRFRPYYLLSPANSADRSYETCTGGGASTCQTTAMPGAWYARTDPIWAAFGVTPPAEDLPASFIGRLHPDITVGQVGVELTVDGPSGPVVLLRPFDHPVTQAEYDRWQAYRQAHQRLDVATFAFITTIAGVVRGPDGDKPSRFSSIYDAYDTTVTTSTPVLTGSAPARIVAGGAMTLHVGSGVNDMSQILAGGALTVTGGRIENRNRLVDAPTVQAGTAIHSFIIAHGSRDDERAYQVVPYSLTTNTTVALAAARLEGNVAVGGNVPSTGPFTPGQTGSAIAGPGKVPGSTVSPIVQVGTVRTSTPSTTIPTASLFTVHPEPGSRYLVETDPRFTSDAQRQRQSSDDLLRQLGIDPDAILKRLGDGYYEQRLIREQIAQLTGRRFLGGFDSDDAQFAALIDAGVTFARRYDLRPGIALTAAQMAQLTSDIVWLVEQSVTLADGSTQRVLVPQVYVRVKDGDIDGSGALLAGESVNLQLTGDLVNEGGTIAGRRVVRIDADSVHNLGGRISGDDVGIRASTDLNVIGGSVDAQRRLDVIAGRDINVVTTTREASSGVGSAAPVGARITAVTRDRVAGLYVTNPGGTLVASAGRDLNLVGGEVRSAGDAHLQAGRDVNLASITTGRSEDIRWSETNSRRGITSEETGSTVQGAGHVGITAGRDISASAATLRAGQYLSIDAGRHLTLEAGQNQRSAQTRHATKDGMSKFNLDAESQDTTLTRTTLEAQRFRLRSGGDTTLSAVEAHGQSLEIDTGGRLNLRTQSTTSAMSRKERDDDAAFASASGSGRTDETSQYNRFNVKDLSIQATVGISADIGQNDSLTTLAQQPGMGWVNRLANDPAFVGSTTWQRVKEEHDRWSYHQSGMGPVTTLVVSVVAAAIAAPAAVQAGAAAGGAATSAGASASISAGASAAVQAGVSAIASRAAVSLAANDGDLGKVIEELTSSEGIKAIATSMLTAGAIEGINTSGLLPENITQAANGSARLPDQLKRQLIDNAAASVVRSAVNGTSLGDELRDGLANALLNTAAAQSAFAIGESGPQGSQRLNAFAAEMAHAMAGCAVGAGRAGTSDGCAPGAIGAVAGHLAAQYFNPTGDLSRNLETIEASRLIGGLAAAVAGGDERTVYLAAAAASNATANNYLANVHKSLSWRASRFAGLSMLESDLLSAAVVLVDFQGPHVGTNGITFDAQDVAHSHMHAMCAQGSPRELCVQRIEDYKQKLWNMKSIAGLAGLLHLYQDGFAEGHADLHIYDGKVDLEHIKGDMTPPQDLARRIIDGSAKLIKDYSSYCQCITSNR
ncbi:DUF637 domain-containing protein [Variovorax sp. KK3]|uniref:two-partner secretion domain-containing protein n=3 Tax=Variovorax sp. KK3 TaxID=1855728 RepID=UPI003AADED4A